MAGSVSEMLVAHQVEEPRSQYGTVDLPCGHLYEGKLLKAVLVREITGDEQDMLSSDRMKPVEKISELLRRCTVKIGEYADPKFIDTAVMDMLEGDRLAMLLGIRRFTTGDIYPFETLCPNLNCDGHRAQAMYRVDLKELDIRTMPDPMKRSYECRLPRSGLAVRWHPMTGRDGEKMIGQKMDKASRAIMARIDLIGTNAPTLAQIKAMGGADIDFLSAEFEVNEGGVDTAIDITCQQCEEEWTMDLDISQEGFFFPTRALQHSKRKSSRLQKSGT